MNATEILKKLRVRSGLALTTYVVMQHPFVCVDFMYDRDENKFALRLSWPGKWKVVHLQDSDVYTKSKSQWKTEQTFHLTDESIARLSPGLDSAIAAIMEKLSKD
jgi:hypothetical protein